MSAMRSGLVLARRLAAVAAIAIGFGLTVAAIGLAVGSVVYAMAVLARWAASLGG
jgi:hypothetical protein